MESVQKTIKEPMLRDLVGANSIGSTCVTGQVGGYSIVVRFGQVKRTLATTRGDIRLFRLDNASKFLCELGIAKFEVDATAYKPGRIRKPRPDRAAALRGTRTKLLQGDLDLRSK